MVACRRSFGKLHREIVRPQSELVRDEAHAAHAGLDFSSRIAGFLDERERRLFAANEALALGRGGVRRYRRRRGSRAARSIAAVPS